MARHIFHLPDIGEGIAEAEIVAWHVAIGDLVEEDGDLVDMMTDKATVAIESPVAGRVVEMAGEEGDLVAIGASLVVLETEASEQNAGGEKRAQKPVPIEAEANALQPTEPEALPRHNAKFETDKAPPQMQTGKVLASPAVRKRARDLGIDLSDVRPLKDGRIRHSDLDGFISYSQGFGEAAEAQPDKQVKVIGLRRKIAENMAASKRHIPHFTFVEECDVTQLENVRADLNAGRGERPKLTLLPLLITALAKVLPDYPMINARYDDELGVVTQHGALHMGIATMTNGGLMVPVVRDAQKLNLWQLAGEIIRLAQAARESSLLPTELTGSTLTISSLGPLGGIASTPVINRPEVAIIAPNRIVERLALAPDGMGGERVEKRLMMNFSLSCDHRVVDGFDAAKFANSLKEMLEHPAQILAD